MGSRGVEVFPPFSDRATRMVDAEEQAFVQEFVPHPTVEALNVSVLHWLSWRDVMPFDAMILRPDEDGVRGELRAVVGDDHARLAATADQIGQLAGDTTTGDRRVRDRGQALARHIVDDIQHPEAPAAGKLVVHEVQ